MTSLSPSIAMSDQDARSANHPIPPLALNADEAAEALRISKRQLMELVAEGEVPHVRIGRRVLFRPDGLDRWLAGLETTRAAAGCGLE